MAQLRFPRPAATSELRYVRAPRPIDFPVEEEVPEGYAHLVVRTFLFRLLGYALGEKHTVGSEQFVYWDASDAKRRLAPDLFVKLDYPQPARMGAWQTWKHGGAPDMAVEVVSPNEGDGVTWDEKLARYHQLGVRELLRFDPEAAGGTRLRAWDRVDEDLVEREISEDRTACAVLGLTWVVATVFGPNGKDAHVGLRLEDGEGRLVETPEESRDTRIRELEEELRRARDGGSPR